RYDIAKVREVCIYVECETVHGYPATGTDTQRADLACPLAVSVQPHARISRIAAGRYTVIGQRAYNCLLQRAQIPVDVCKEVVEIQYRVSHNLSGAMICNVAAAVNFVKGCPLFSETFFIEEEILCFAAFTQCVNMRMFGENEVIFGWPGGSMLAVCRFLCRQL